jgi:hypothetical protein
MTQRVAKVEGSLSGKGRKTIPSVSPAAAASERRRMGTCSIVRVRISPMTAPTARQRSASSITHSTSRECGTATVINRSGSTPV